MKKGPEMFLESVCGSRSLPGAPGWLGVASLVAG